MIKPHVHIPYDRLEKYFSLIKQAGINLEIYFGSKELDDLNKPEIIRLKERLDYNPAITIHSPFMDLSPGAVDSKVRAVTIERFNTILDFAEILKPEIIVFHSGYDKWKYNRRVDVWLEGSLITWKPLNKRASEMGIKIAIENVFEDEPSNFKLLMHEMNSENFGVCFDTGHFNLFSKVSLEEWLSVIKPYIIELHLHDNDKTADSHLAVGEGSFDFKRLFDELKGKNFIYTVEAHTPEDTRKSLERLEAYLR
ncbi:MAG TPA: AP endonuclease [Nitrospiraceae bacterium]|nr:AP endonuclease [Nitrospiraceae bacterium]